MGYTPNYSHLVGIMISKTIGCRGTLFSDKPTCFYRRFTDVSPSPFCDLHGRNSRSRRKQGMSTASTGSVQRVHLSPLESGSKMPTQVQRKSTKRPGNVRKCQETSHQKSSKSSLRVPIKCHVFCLVLPLAAFWCQVIYEPTGETLRVPFRRIHLTDEEPGCDHLDVYDTSGPVGPSLSAFAQAVHLVSCLSCSSCFTVRSKKSAVRLIIEAALLSWPPCFERWQLTAVLWGTSPREGLPKLRKEWIQRRAAAAGIPGENGLWKLFKKNQNTLCVYIYI